MATAKGAMTAEEPSLQSYYRVGWDDAIGTGSRGMNGRESHETAQGSIGALLQ